MNWETEDGVWEIDDDAKDLIYVSREEEYPHRLIITQEQADNIEREVWKTIKSNYIIIKKEKSIKSTADFVTYKKALNMLEENTGSIPISNVKDLLQQEVENGKLPIYELVRVDDLGNLCAARFEQMSPEFLIGHTPTTFLVCFAYVRVDDLQKAFERIKKFKKKRGIIK